MQSVKTLATVCRANGVQEGISMYHPEVTEHALLVPSRHKPWKRHGDSFASIPLTCFPVTAADRTLTQPPSFWIEEEINITYPLRRARRDRGEEWHQAQSKTYPMTAWGPCPIVCVSFLKAIWGTYRWGPINHHGGYSLCFEPPCTIVLACLPEVWCGHTTSFGQCNVSASSMSHMQTT